MTIHAQLRAHLAPLIANQSEVARAVGVERSNLNAWLRGRPTLRLESIEAIAAHLGRRVKVTMPRR